MARRGAGAGADLKPPDPGGDPREALRWVRWMEIVTSLGAIGFGIALWNEGWWHWLLIGIGVSGLVPWWGPARILRKAERDPSVLTTDLTPEERRERGRRAGLATLAVLTAAGAAVGYAADGSGAAVFMALALGASGALGLWLYLRWSK